MNLPFRRRGTRLEPQPAPWSSTDGEGAMFLLKGDAGRLQTLCDDMLQATKGLAYEPIDEYVMLTIQRIEGFHSTSKSVPPAECVAYDYGEAAFWVPVRDRSTGAEAFILPYVFHDRTVPTSVGRELWGLAKESADVDFGLTGSGFAARGQVRALVWDGAPHKPQLRNVLEVVPPLPFAWHATEVADRDLLESGVLDAFLAPLGLGGAALRMLLKGRFDFLLLRQMPAPDAHGCDLQKVVRLPVNMKSSLAQARPLYPGHAIALPPAYSHPVASDFGFTTDAQHQVVAALGIRASFAFELGQGQTIA